MYKLSFRPLAKSDIQNIIDYYDSINPKLSAIFFSELAVSIKHIQNMHEAIPKRLGNIRASFLKRFRFGVYFKIYDYGVVVIAVLHTSRNPQIWKKH